MTESRKLAAVLAADVVGFSRLTRADEDRTLARLRALRSGLIDPTIAVHNGRVVKRTGRRRAYARRPCARPLRRRARWRHRPDRQGAQAQPKSRVCVVPRRIPESLERKAGQLYRVLRARHAFEPPRPRDVSNAGWNGDGASVCRALRYGVFIGGECIQAFARLPDGRRRHRGESCACGSSGEGPTGNDSYAGA